MTGCWESLAIEAVDWGAVSPWPGKLLALASRLGIFEFSLLLAWIASRHRSRLAVLFRRVLRSALGLNIGGPEDAVFAIFAFGQRLSVVLESVRWSFGAAVHHWNHAAFFDELELEVGSLALDGAWSDVASDAQPLAVGVGTHAVQFLDGDVIALAVLNAGVGEIAERNNDNDDDRAEAQVSTALY